MVSTVSTALNLDTQKARSISARVEEVAAEVAAERRRDVHRLLQACLYECVALAKQWRAAVEYFTNSLSHDPKNFDYRNLRDVLLPAAERTQAIYSEMESMLEKSSHVIQDRNDLTLAVIEARNIVKWFQSWPTNDPTIRNAAREAIAREESLTEAELAAMFSP